MKFTRMFVVLLFLLVSCISFAQAQGDGSEREIAFPGDWSPVEIIEEGISSAEFPQFYSAEIIIPLIHDYKAVAVADEISDRFTSAESMDMKVAIPFAANAYVSDPLDGSVDIGAYLSDIELTLGNVRMPETRSTQRSKNGNESLLQGSPGGANCGGYPVGTRVIDSNCVPGIGIVVITYECQTVSGANNWYLIDSRTIYSPSCDPNH